MWFITSWWATCWLNSTSSLSSSALSILEGAEPSVEVLSVRADAADGAGRLEAELNAKEALHARHLADGQVADAAWTAATIAMQLLVDTGLMAAVRDWVGRAERLLDEETGQASALLAALRAYERLLCGDAEAASRHAQEAVALGSSHGVDLAVVIGRIATARLMTMIRRVDDGMAILDEVAVDLMVRQARRLPHRQHVPRGGLRRPGATAPRPGTGMDRRHGAMAARGRLRGDPRALPDAPRRAAPDQRAGAGCREGGAGGVCGAPAVDAK